MTCESQYAVKTAHQQPAESIPKLSRKPLFLPSSASLCSCNNRCVKYLISSASPSSFRLSAAIVAAISVDETRSGGHNDHHGLSNNGAVITTSAARHTTVDLSDAVERHRRRRRSSASDVKCQTRHAVTYLFNPWSLSRPQLAFLERPPWNDQAVLVDLLRLSPARPSSFEPSVVS
jgi:hypothetical protein